MRNRLEDWLKFRTTLDEYAAGKRKGAPAWLRNPGSKPIPPGIIKSTLRRDRFPVEQDLAETLFALLVECGLDGSTLPQPNVSVDPDAAAKLAQIAVCAKTPTEKPEAQGLGFPFWMLAIPIAGVVLVLAQLIKSKADVAVETERLRCIESGACTDAGFWLKVGSIAVVAWLAWSKLGIREMVKKRTGAT
jgi:hypothetical protein